MCQQGCLEMGLGLPEAVPWNFFPSTDAFCMAPVCQNMVKRPYLRQRVWIEMASLCASRYELARVCLAGRQDQSFAEDCETAI